MRNKISFFVIGLFVALVSCTAPTNPIPPGRNFNFKVLSWPGGTGRLTLAEITTTYILGSTQIATDGSFSFTLPATPSITYPINQQQIPGGCSVTDLTAKTFFARPRVVRDAEGVLRDLVLTNGTSINDPLLAGRQNLLGVIYSDKSFTATGLCDIDNPVSETYSYVKGWNYVLIEWLDAGSSFRFLVAPNVQLNAVIGEPVVQQASLRPQSTAIRKRFLPFLR